MGDPDEVTAALRDLYQAGCEIITITQYLRPSAAPSRRALGQAGVRRARQGREQMGFAGVMAGPLVRSSYRAGGPRADRAGPRRQPLPGWSTWPRRRGHPEARSLAR